MAYIEIKEGRISEIILNRPEKRNAFNSELVSELTAAFKELDESNKTRVIILKANGPAFSAGADLAYLQQLQKNTFEENLVDSGKLKNLFEFIYYSRKPIIAQVEGPAIAGGCGLATICDFVFAKPDVTFGYTEVKIGFVPAIVMFFLLRKVGESVARPLLLSGKLISAEEALAKGLIYEIVNEGDINEYVYAFAEKLASETSPQSIALTRQMISEIQNMETEEALRYAARQNALARSNEDCKKGINAFVNKEKIRW